MPSLPFATVNSEDQLNVDIAALARQGATYPLTFGSSFTLNTDFYTIGLGTGGSLTINGAGYTIGGAGRFRGLTVCTGADDVSARPAAA